jgi:F-type H+-transporting ATPase subunit delta
MKISRESRKMAREMFRLSCEDGRLVGARAVAIASRVAELRPRGAVGTLKEFAKRVRLELARRHATVESATPLSPEQTSQINKQLAVRFGSDLSAEFHVTPELIGGLRVQVGSDVWDGSVAARLTALKKQI